MAWSTCYTCKCQMWIDTPLNEAALKGRGAVLFYCSYGHSQHYIVGESEETKLRRERDRLTQRLAEKDDEIKRQRGLREGYERRLSATRGVVTRIKNRVGKGVCPCCNRTFENLHRHMAAKHPEFHSEPAEAAE